MINLNKYIVEKLRLNKDTEISINTDEINKEFFEQTREFIEEFFNKECGKFGEDWEYKVDKYNNFLVYIYEGGKERFEELSGKFWKQYYIVPSKSLRKETESPSNSFYEVRVTNYGVKIFTTYMISREDFDKIKFR